MKYLLSILALFLLLGCGSKRMITNTVSTLDSTYVKSSVKLRDTIIQVPFYKVAVSSLQDKLTEKPIKRTQGNASVELYKKNETIFASASCDSLELELQLRDRIISTFRERSTDTQTTLPQIEVKYIPWIIKMLAWIGGIALLILGIKVALFIYKPKFL